jgi:ADP-heptose:LPS heptosyltransferase/ubiquinone/menaquinone biosynthesis C-methylase UbiE
MKENLWIKMKRKIKDWIYYEKYLVLKGYPLPLYKIIYLYLIGPSKWPKKVYSCVKDDVRKVIEEYGVENLSKCPICGCEKFVSIGEKDFLAVVQCSKCSHYFLNPRLPERSLGEIYGKDYSSRRELLKLRPLDDPLQIEFEINIAKKRLKFLLSAFPSAGKLLDFGCGKGYFLIEAQKSGFDVVGLDINENLTKELQGKVNIINERLEDIKFNEREFDVITAFEVLEHLYNPIEVLNHFYRLLKDNGVLHVSVPIYSSRMMSDYHIYWGQVNFEHIQMYTLESIRRLFEKTGFKIIDIETSSEKGSGYEGNFLFLLQKNKKINNPSKILVIRKEMRGDVTLALPVLKKLKEKFPNSILYFTTDYPEILENFPYVDVVSKKIPPEKFDFIVNLRYEIFPHLARIDAYAQIAGVEISDKDKRNMIYLSDKEVIRGKEILKDLGVFDNEKIVIIHAGKINEYVRNWDVKNWKRLVNYIKSKYDFKIFTVGCAEDIMIDGTIDLRGKTSIRELFAIISLSHIVLCIDSFVLHIGTMFSIPTIGLFGATESDKVVFLKDTLFAIQANIDCAGCWYRQLPPIYGVACRWKRPKCMRAISVDDVKNAVDNIVKKYKL